MLRRVRGSVYCVHSPTDIVLRDIVRFTGTVDRRDAAEGVAGLEGFHLPTQLTRDTPKLYAKLNNVPYRDAFADVGYYGQHMDCTHGARGAADG
jgi:hypothetical protein